MTTWEHCCLEWTQSGTTLTVYPQSPQRFHLSEYERIFAQLGSEGWELVSSLGSPTGTHDYWFYFKRPMETS